MAGASCSARSRALEEPMHGTADHVDCWILLEYRGAWGAQALAENALSAATQDWLRRSLRGCAARGLRPRVLLMRQSESDGPGITLLINRSGIEEPVLLRFELEDYAALADIDAVRCAAEPQRCTEQRERRSHYLVCVNGERDRCCGLHGAATYTALRARLGERVWQCTHLGGHRFAPNVLRLPDAVLYGRVRQEEVPEFLAHSEAGSVPTRWLRGRSAWPPRLQAAEALLGEQPVPPRLLDEEAIDEARWRVRFELQRGPREIEVTLGEAVAVRASCADAGTKPVRHFRRGG